MRVVGGSIKGRRLITFKSTAIRPTSDKVREAIFNVLPRPFPFKNVLDLFAGTGGLGIEALSRGALSATFVDVEASSCRVIKENLDKCGMFDKSVVIKRDAVSWIESCSAKDKIDRFDLVFLDAPYKDNVLTEKALEALKQKNIITDDCFIVCETSSKEKISSEVIEKIGFEFIKEKTYGDTSVCFMQNKLA